MRREKCERKTYCLENVVSHLTWKKFSFAWNFSHLIDTDRVAIERVYESIILKNDNRKNKAHYR